MRYWYSTVRFVPDPMTGEFVNAAVIVGSDETLEWRLRQTDNLKRINALDIEGASAAIWRFLTRVQDQLDRMADDEPPLDGYAVVSAEWLERLAGEMVHNVQLSAPLVISADSIDQAEHRAVDAMLLAATPASQREFTKNTALKLIRDAYRTADLTATRDYFEKVEIAVGSYVGTMDFAVANGRAVQLTQAFSLAAANGAAIADQVRSWAWLMERTRESDVAHISAPHARIDVASDIQLEVVTIGEPNSQSMFNAREQLEAASMQLNARIRKVGEIGQVASEARALLGR